MQWLRRRGFQTDSSHTTPETGLEGDSTSGLEKYVSVNCVLNVAPVYVMNPVPFRFHPVP